MNIFIVLGLVVLVLLLLAVWERRISYQEYVKRKESDHRNFNHKRSGKC